jgi:hypothetical protein
MMTSVQSLGQRMPWFAILFLLTVGLYGCSTVHVECGPTGFGPNNVGMGACIPIDASGQSAQNFLIANNHVPTTLKVTDATIMCPAGSTKCAGLPGRCNNKPCKSWWDQTLSTCYCDCL